MPTRKSKAPFNKKSKFKLGLSQNQPHVVSDDTNNSVTIDSGLYIVSTPIGNAMDISYRAIDVLKRVSAVICEDTRVTKKLFSMHQIKNTLIIYHEHNAQKIRPLLIKRLQKRDSIAIVSDAGSPLISDPGYKLVRDCVDNNIPLTVVPGASSVLAALTISGLPTDRFFLCYANVS